MDNATDMSTPVTRSELRDELAHLATKAELVAVSSIVGVRYNEAVFVVMPLDVVLPFLGARRRRRYALGRIAVLAMVSLLAAVGVLHQPLWTLILVVLVPMLTIALDLLHGLFAQRGGAEPRPKPSPSSRRTLLPRSPRSLPSRPRPNRAPKRSAAS